MPLCVLVDYIEKVLVAVVALVALLQELYQVDTDALERSSSRLAR
jgi:hypothetical protein